jgi:hypothetical protein
MTTLTWNAILYADATGLHVADTAPLRLALQRHDALRAWAEAR